jgi:hypothetical protein
MRWKTLLILLVVLATLGTGAYLGFSQFDRLCTELAINHYRVRPSTAGAATLAKLVDGQSATPEQVERILPLLFTPTVTKDPTYPLGSTPVVRVELPFEVVLRNLIADTNEFVWVNGECRSGTGVVGVHTLRKESHNLRLYPTPSKPGTYTMEIRYAYRLRPQRTRAWRWNPVKGIILPRRAFLDVPESAQGKPKYECSIIVPVEIVVVDTSRTNP